MLIKFVFTDKQKHVMLFSLPLINFVYLQAKHTFFENLQCVKSVAYKSAHQENWKLFTSISIWNSADRHVSVNIHGWCDRLAINQGNHFNRTNHLVKWRLLREDFRNKLGLDIQQESTLCSSGGVLTLSYKLLGQLLTFLQSGSLHMAAQVTKTLKKSSSAQLFIAAFLPQKKICAKQD